MRHSTPIIAHKQTLFVLFAEIGYDPYKLWAIRAYVMVVLGIETSCDDTGVALYCHERGLLADALYSQLSLHAKYGGVVPELASRDHIRRLIPLINEITDQAGLTLSDIDAIAYTKGPGLVGALLVGASFANGLGLALSVPVIGIHHLEAHLLAPMLEETKPSFPFLALLVSGGHTQLIQVSSMGQYTLLGDTVDDAVGEAFDKTAKLLGLSYPGGPALAKCALKGNKARFTFPCPMTNRPGLDFSFSGLKTYALNTIQGLALTAQDKADVACAFEEAVVKTLTLKCKRALMQTKLSRLVVAGGVSANIRLRENLKRMAKACSVEVYFPRQAFCTDNGAMVALAGAIRMAKNEATCEGLEVRARWPLDALADNHNH